MLASHLLRHVIREGTLELIDATSRRHVFAGTPAPRVTIRLHDRALHWKLFTNPALHLGEAYMEGTLTVDSGDIHDLLDLAGRNIGHLETHPLQAVIAAARRLARGIEHYNPITRAERNVAHHYDLSDELYNLFLDRDRQYSCAYFRDENDSLDTAQENKKRHIAGKLCLAPGQRVLDIGCGWGGLALTLAETANVEVTGITLSQEQLKVARERAAASGLGDRVKFELMDYRLVEDRFDRIVSVGMFEHVGSSHYRAFFRKIRHLLSEDGLALLHSIGRMEPPGVTNPWLKKYIFPGGYTPAISEVMAALEKTGLWTTDIEVLRLHYAFTLKHWRQRFHQQWDSAAQLYDERFCRMWDFYLAGCEAAFRHMGQMVFQMQIARKPDAAPLTRDYMYPEAPGASKSGSIAA